MGAVLDPNVLVSAAISPAGPPRQILTAWTQERFELIAGSARLDELVDVLARPKFRRFITTAVAAEFIDGFAADAVIVADPPEPPDVSPDPDDDYLIALARVAGADCLVSGDRFLDLTDLDPPVLTRRQFLNVLDISPRSTGWTPADLVPGRHRRPRRDRPGRGRRPRPRSLRDHARRQPRLLGHKPARAEHAPAAPPTRTAAMAEPRAFR